VSGASGRSGHVLDDQHRRPLGVVVPQLDEAQLPAAAERDHPLDDLPGDPERPRGNMPGDRARSPLCAEPRRGRAQAQKRAR
jgi:hypothetical protein